MYVSIKISDPNLIDISLCSGGINI